MNKAEIMEIKKRFGFSDCSFSGFAYITIEKDSEGYHINDVISDKFLTQEDPVRKKYLSLIGKAYSSAGGAFAEDIEVTGDDKKMLTALSKGQEPDKGLVKSWAEEIMREYDPDSSYALIIFSDAYDIPSKDSAKIKTGESDEVYSYIAACICPFKPSDGGIILTEDKRLEAADVFRKLSNPVAGFMYPAFKERSSDYDHMFVVVKNEPERDLIRKAYSQDVPPLEKAKKAAKKRKEEKEAKAAVKDTSSYEQYHEEHIGMSEDADTSIRQNAPIKIIDNTGAYGPDINEITTADFDTDRTPYSNRKDISGSEKDDTDSHVQGTKDKISVPTDHIIERDVNGTKFFMIPETLISYEKLKMLIEREREEK